MKQKLAFIIVIVLVAGIAGCTKTENATSAIANPAIQVSPADGTTNVRLDESVVFTFAKSVDRRTVERSIHIISERAMADSLCPISDSMGHGMMVNAMMDSMKMNHLMALHSTSGKFQWNGNNTQCILQPDSMMMPNMRYMIHMGSEMIKMMESQVGDMNMMGNHGTGMMTNDMFYHFTTMDTTQVGTGHDGHH